MPVQLSGTGGGGLRHGELGGKRETKSIWTVKLNAREAEGNVGKMGEKSRSRTIWMAGPNWDRLAKECKFLQASEPLSS
jgi:hypothetical protein